MATDIVWSDLVGVAKDTTDGGYIGDLLKLARAHIEEAVLNNELTREQAGDVYTAMIPAAYQNGITFGMQEKISEAQADKIIFDSRLALLASKLVDLPELFSLSGDIKELHDELTRTVEVPQ